MLSSSAYMNSMHFSNATNTWLYLTLDSYIWTSNNHTSITYSSTYLSSPIHLNFSSQPLTLPIQFSSLCVFLSTVTSIFGNLAKQNHMELTCCGLFRGLFWQSSTIWTNKQYMTFPLLATHSHHLTIPYIPFDAILSLILNNSLASIAHSAHIHCTSIAPLLHTSIVHPSSIHHVSLWKFQSLDEVKTLVYMEVYILNRLLSFEEYFILNVVED